MAKSRRHIDVLTEHGVTRVNIRYMRPFTQVVTVKFCWLHDAGVEHWCDDEGCWS